MLKRFIIFFVGLMLFTGCAKNPDKLEISFMSWGSITEVGVIKKLISDFEKENPDIRIKFMHTPQNYFQKLHLLFASNTAPDVIFINNLNLPVYSDYLMDLSEFIEKEDFYKAPLEGLTYDGKLLAIPRDASNLVLYVNKNVVNVSNKKWTLEELLKTAQKATNEKHFGIGFEEDIYWVLPYLSYYGEVFDENFEPQNSKGFKFYKDLRDKYKVAPKKSQIGSSTLAQMFLDEKIAIYPSGRWMYPKIKESATFDWEIIPFPRGIKPYPSDTSGWALSKSTKNKKEAIRFIKYLSQEKSSEYFAQTGLIVPARIKASKLLENNRHSERVFLEVLKESEKTPVSEKYNKIVSQFNVKNF